MSYKTIFNMLLEHMKQCQNILCKIPFQLHFEDIPKEVELKLTACHYPQNIAQDLYCRLFNSNKN